MLATTGEQGEPIAAPCSCLRKLPWNVNTQFSRTSLRSFINSSFMRPQVLLVKKHPYLLLALGSSMCSVNSLLITSRTVGTGILVKSWNVKGHQILINTDVYWPEILTETLAVLHKWWCNPCVLLDDLGQEFGQLVCSGPTSWNYGAHGTVGLVYFS